MRSSSDNSESNAFITKFNIMPADIVIGQQAYKSLLFQYLFSFVCQDVKQCGHLLKDLPREHLLMHYIDNTVGPQIWASNKIGTNQKLRISYGLLGKSFMSEGFDRTFYRFEKALENEIDKILNCPIASYTQFLEVYLSETNHPRLRY